MKKERKRESRNDDLFLWTFSRCVDVLRPGDPLRRELSFYFGFWGARNKNNNREKRKIKAVVTFFALSPYRLFDRPHFRLCRSVFLVNKSSPWSLAMRSTSTEYGQAGRRTLLLRHRLTVMVMVMMQRELTVIVCVTGDFGT
jgi:hypothetical protein